VPAIPNPYTSGCRIVAGDPRSSCRCFALCAVGHPPADRYVVDFDQNDRYPFNLFPKRTLFQFTGVSPVFCIFHPMPGQGIPGPPVDFFLWRTVAAGLPGPWDWMLRIVDTPSCIATQLRWTVLNGVCCQDEYPSGVTSWAFTLCASVPPLPDVNIWPVRFDFEVADL